jgi:O-antigen ligase
VLADFKPWQWSILLGGCFIITVSWFVLATLGNDTLLLMPFAICGAIAGGYLIWEAAFLRRWALLVFFFISVFMLSLVFRLRPLGSIELDPQNFAKAITWVALIGVCAFNYRQIAPYFRYFPLTALAWFCGICLLSALYAPSPLFSAISELGVISYLLFAILLVSQFSGRTVTLLALWTLFALCVLNLASEVLLPDVAWIFPDKVTQPDVTRLAGLSGQPNTLGRLASVTLMTILVAMWRGYVKPVWAMLLGLLPLLLLIQTESRTSLFALVLAVVFLLPKRILIALGSLTALLIAFIVISGHVNTIFALIGRDGNVSEAESMSGRTDLWVYVWNLIVDSPIIGYGFNSFEVIASRTWIGDPNAVAATHNNYLSVLFSTGVIGAIPFLLGIGSLVYYWFKRPSPARDLFVLNVLFTGFAEADFLTTVGPVLALNFFIIIAEDAKTFVPLVDRESALS